jgi:DNA-binding transcriptional ArsR family regulator
MRIDLLIHPVRLRIIQALGQERLTTRELAERLPEVPVSSLYRHLQLLRRGDVLDVVETRLVNGIEEKVYAVTGRTHLTQEEMAELSAEEHVKYFATYLLTVLQNFAAYVAGAEERDGTVNLAADHAGYTEVTFYADEAELHAFQTAMNKAVLPLIKNEAGPERRRYRLAIIAHPTGDRHGRHS